jgi:hypothetical protein
MKRGSPDLIRTSRNAPATVGVAPIARARSDTGACAASVGRLSRPAGAPGLVARAVGRAATEGGVLPPHVPATTGCEAPTDRVATNLQAR